MNAAGLNGLCRIHADIEKQAYISKVRLDSARPCSGTNWIADKNMFQDFRPALGHDLTCSHTHGLIAKLMAGQVFVIYVVGRA